MKIISLLLLTIITACGPKAHHQSINVSDECILTISDGTDSEPVQNSGLDPVEQGLEKAEQTNVLSLPACS